MAQHDGVIDNQAGAAFRADLNNFLLAILSNSSGATGPATTYAYQFWADTTTGLLKQRNAANSAWITIGTLASAYLGLEPALTVGSQAEMEAGTEAALRSMSPLRVAQAIATLVPTATQAEQEAATSLVKYVSPGRQHYHPSAAKAWYHITYSAGTPTLSAGYGVSSITDSAVGKVAINFSTSFSTGNFGNACASQNSGSNVSSDAVVNKAAGSVTHEHYEEGGIGTAADPVYVSGVFYGDL